MEYNEILLDEGALDIKSWLPSGIMDSLAELLMYNKDEFIITAETNRTYDMGDVVNRGQKSSLSYKGPNNYNSGYDYLQSNKIENLKNRERPVAA